MKTRGMDHQLRALREMSGRTGFALFMEQGTGKTWTLLADAERLYASGKIDAVLVIAPNGVHTNWVRREIPTHMDANVIARYWRSGAGKRHRAQLEELLRPRGEGEAPPLRILAINIDAIATKDGLDFALRFLNATRALIIIDESARIKNLDARRTKIALGLRKHAVAARIASGLPITNSPLDIFAQMEFLESGLLGTASFRAFAAEYAELLQRGDPMFDRLVQRNPNSARAMIVARDENGAPRWRNLERLQKLIAPHSFRVLKRDCLDLPDKIYKQHYFDLAPKQRAAYELMEQEFRIQLEDGSVEPVAELAGLMKLQQITSGFVIVPGRDAPMYIEDDNPRLKALIDLVEDIDGKFIVWARFREELRAIARALTAAGVKVVEYHGGIGSAARELAVDEFQSGSARAFVGQQHAGGIGLTLTAAENVIYYSNDFDLDHRKQSEDRAHRIGTVRNVVYTDLVATETVDEPIAKALQRKERLAAQILGDRNLRVHESTLRV